MTNNNLNNFYQLPKTATVSYYDIESDQNLACEKWQQTHSLTGQITIINKSGGNYHSEKLLNDDREVRIYGPGVWEDLFSATVVATTTPIKEVSKLAVSGGYCVLNEPLARFGTKIIITTSAGVILGSGVIPIGAVLWAGSNIIRENLSDGDAREILKFIEDCGEEMVRGGLIGVAAQSGGAILGFKKALGLGKNVPGAFNSAKHGIKVAGNAEFWISKGAESKDATYHIMHKQNGIEYKIGCKVCEM